MIKHIVVWKLKEQAAGNVKARNASLLKEKLEALNGNIDGLLLMEVGIDFSGTDRSGDIVAYSEFTSREALAAYMVHPLHQAVIPFVVEVVSERRVVDYEA